MKILERWHRFHSLALHRLQHDFFFYLVQVDRQNLKTILRVFQALVFRANVDPGLQEKVMVISVCVLKVSLEISVKRVSNVFSFLYLLFLISTLEGEKTKQNNNYRCIRNYMFAKNQFMTLFSILRLIFTFCFKVHLTPTFFP